ncbi:MSHA biogenesis protein MshN [Vibrio sinensis]|uniref:MSHA biogenesis protein MshN n=1 Tax=Vibrio sinensis TaxID=2302434 RepID=A0A3A6R3Q3_9VIBR|nr:tetratricopeptide repeat protein [Vibrio sinensis]RJX70679.1 MSHA biogenesis protein MshN [Vibrio sinensis]
MSAINNALSALSDKQSQVSSGVERAHIKPIKSASVLPWIIGGFSLSLAVGGWAVSKQAETITHRADISMATSSDLVELNGNPTAFSSPTALTSPTVKVTLGSESIYQAENTDWVEMTPSQSVSVTQKPQTSPASGSSASTKATSKPITIQEPVLIARVATDSHESAKQKALIPPTTTPQAQVSGEMVIEQIELTPSQLAEKSRLRAEKALDSNNLKEALTQYKDALRYTPKDALIRQKLTALYYGKGDVRKAVDLLQKGIELDKSNQELRLALTKLLLKEKQNTAALTPLVYLPIKPSVEYLSLRAALAQKADQDAMALESYQRLTSIEPDNGRWWLGLAIQQERDLSLSLAKESYTNALNNLGLSSASQQFIRDRLVSIENMEGASYAN